jgi:hypothetical protein
MYAVVREEIVYSTISEEKKKQTIAGFMIAILASRQWQGVRHSSDSQRRMQWIRRCHRILTWILSLDFFMDFLFFIIIIILAYHATLSHFYFII